MMETSDSPNTPGKPVVIIKKGALFKTVNRPIILKTIIKRPNLSVSVEDNPSAKRLCPDFATPIKAEAGVEVNDTIEIQELKDTIQLRKPEQTIDKQEKKKTKSILARQAGGVCMGHDEPLLEHQADGLLQPGDTFPSIDEFTKYICKYAKKWHFYYVRSETRLNKSTGTCTYRCRHFRKHMKSESNGKRVLKNMSLSLKCPASVYLKRKPNSEEMRVTMVCHHHTHELSKEFFDQQPHGYRLPQEIKDEIRDLALFNVHPSLIRSYVESKVPDLNLGKTVINTVLKLKSQGITKSVLSPQRIIEMLEKIKYIKTNFDMTVTTGSRPRARRQFKKIINSKTGTSEVKTATNKKIKIDLTSDEELDQGAVSECTNDESTCKWEEELLYDTTIENDSTNEELCATYTYASDVEAIDTTYDEEIEYKPIRLINPTTGAFDDVDPDDHELLINPETGMLDEKATISEPITEETLPSTSKKQYKIGNISIEYIESIDESGIATVTLNKVQSQNRGITDSSILSQLSIVERAIAEPHIYSPKTAKARGTCKNKKKDPLEAAKMKCQVKHDELPEQQAEGLIQVGSTFSSIEELLTYSASHASKWYFYYHVLDSRNTKSSPKYDSSKSVLYHLNCRFNKGFYKSKSKGLRKLKQQKSNIHCPAGLNLKCMPGQDVFTVTYACHHHSHELSAELFSQEAHGHRLPQELKEEIRALAWYKLDTRLIKLYLEDITGLNMGKTVKNIVATIKKKGLKIDVPPERVTEILEKIKEIKQKFQIPKRVPTVRTSKSRRETKDDTSDSDREVEEENKSRVETRLNNILYDQELIQSVKELQENTGCEIEINPWGGVNVIHNKDNLQEGMETEYNDSQDTIEKTECRIKIDQELYHMDDNVEYIIPTDQVGNIVGVEFSGEGERVVYIQENTGEIVPEVNNTIEYDETVIYEDETEVLNVVECAENVYDNNEVKHEIAIVENIPKVEECNQVAYDCSDNENEYQMMYQYTNDEEHGNDVQHYDKEAYYECRDVGVQADLPIIELEREYEKLSKLESSVVRQYIGKSKYSHSSRSQPTYIMEEGIINRFNIDFYINQCGVSTCLENLAANMGISVINLLKQVYQGEAVFKMTLGRSGRQNRKTVHLAHVPLTIAFPFEKFKYGNCLQVYKNICSKYSDVAMQLENTVQTVSKALEAKTLELGTVQQNSGCNQQMEKYENLLKTNTLLKESLTKYKTELAETKQQNNDLTEKIQFLEDLNLSSRVRDAEILKQLLRPKAAQEANSNAINENTILKNKIRELSKELHEKTQNKVDNKLVERNKELEDALAVAKAEHISCKSKIKKLEQLYLTDSQSLLDKISTLEAEIETYKEESDDNFAENNNALKLLAIAESKCSRLEKQVKDLQQVRLVDKKGPIKVNNRKNMVEEAPIIKKVYGTRSRQKND